MTCLITSILHIANDHGDVKLNRRARGTFILWLYTWHLWHFSDIFYAIHFHGHWEIPWLLYFHSRHMSTSMSCINIFVNFLERFLLLSHQNILTMFHLMTSCTTLLHWGNNPWLTFARFSYLYWMPLGGTSGVR